MLTVGLLALLAGCHQDTARIASLEKHIAELQVQRRLDKLEAEAQREREPRHADRWQLVSTELELMTVAGYPRPMKQLFLLDRATGISFRLESDTNAAAWLRLGHWVPAPNKALDLQPTTNEWGDVRSRPP